MGCPLRYHPGVVGGAVGSVSAATYAGGAFRECLRDKCHWWDQQEERCAVRVQADYARVLYRFMSAWYKKHAATQNQPPSADAEAL